MAHAGGRPSKYTPELGKKICRAIATSTDSLRKICASNKDFPDKSTLMEWKYDFQEFGDQYAKAKAEQADLFAQEILEISDDEAEDLIQGEHGMIANPARIQRHRLRVDSRKWIACKLLPKVYGDKQEIKQEVSVSVHEADLEHLK